MFFKTSNILLFAGFISFISCSNADLPTPQENNEKPGYPEGYTDVDPVSVNVWDGDTITWVEYYQGIGNTATDWSQNTIKTICTVQANSAKAEVDAIAKKYNVSSSDVVYGYQYYKYSYLSIDKNGLPKTLSGLIAFSYNNFEKTNPSNVLLYNHILICSDKETPSEIKYFENYLSDTKAMMDNARTCSGDCYNALIIIPDMQGYGLSKNDEVPLLDNTLTPRQMVDGFRAGLVAFKKIDPDNTLKDDWKSVVLGYSLGGEISMGVHKFIEENNQTEELHFKGSICGGGPYNLCATLEYYLESNETTQPHLLAMVVSGMNVTNGVVDNHGLDAYFTQEFINSGIFEKLDSKTLLSSEIENYMVVYNNTHNNCFGAEDGLFKIDKVFTPQVIDYLKDCTNGKPENKGDACYDLYEALEMNVLTKGWSPKNRMFLYHSANDEIAPYFNLELCQKTFNNSDLVKTLSINSGYGHLECGYLFVITYKNNLINAIFNDSTWNSYK